MRKFFLLAVLSLLPLWATGQTSLTMDKVQRSGQIVLGIRPNALPFSDLSQGVAKGYSVDLCHKVLDTLRKDLKLTDLKVRYVPVSAADRIGKLKSGEIDMECGSTVNTRSRQADVAFSYATYVAGERLLVRADSDIHEIDDLPGKSIAVLKGSTAEKMFTQIRDSKFPTLKLVKVDSTLDAFSALTAGQVVAVAQLDILEEGIRQSGHDPAAYRLVGKALSIEPMALMVRKDDPAFLKLVDGVLAGVYASGEINTIYDRWFNRTPFQIPMSRMLRDAIRHPHREPAVALGLGYQL